MLDNGIQVKNRPGLLSGMRLGEIFGLSWDAIVDKKGIIYVKRALVTSRAGVNFEEPKTNASRDRSPCLLI